MSRCQVQFVGGPLDGYSQQISMPAQAFLGVAMLSRWHAGDLLRRLLDGCGLGSARPRPVGLAIYELDERDGQWQYRHVSTQLTTAAGLPRLGRFGRISQVPIPVLGLGESTR